MKLRLLNIRQLLIMAFLIICYQHEAISQVADTTKRKQLGLFIGLSMGPSQSDIINEGTLSVSKFLSAKQTSFFGSIEIGYFFSKYIGLSSGIGYISYKTQLTLDTYQNNFNTTDSENESYERRVSGSNIKELQKVDFLNIPFCINLRLPFNKTMGFFLQTGVNMAVPIIKNYKSSGTFTYKGYYPAYNVLLENIPAYGFPSNISIDTQDELKLKPLVFNTIASVGFDFNIQKKLQIAVAACYSKSLTNKSNASISDYASPDTFHLSSSADHINSLMGGSSKTTLESMGLEIIFRYYLTTHR